MEIREFTQPSPDLTEKKNPWQRIEEYAINMIAHEKPDMDPEEIANMVNENLEKHRGVIETVLAGNVEDPEKEEKNMAKRIADDVLGKTA
ncbi:MAG TPA: hypothetical protein VK255_01875 [Patescibacteria group bacterium]|nr:hypothetical protein [Patescibacteria group bacterium]